MFGFSVWELVLVLFVIVLLFGVGRLPELGTALGEGIKNFKKGYKEPKTIDVSKKED